MYRYENNSHHISGKIRLNTLDEVQNTLTRVYNRIEKQKHAGKYFDSNIAGEVLLGFFTFGISMFPTVEETRYDSMIQNTVKRFVSNTTIVFYHRKDYKRLARIPVSEVQVLQFYLTNPQWVAPYVEVNV